MWRRTAITRFLCVAALAGAPGFAQEPIVRASVSTVGAEGDGASMLAGPGSISADGRFVVFQSFARNLVADDRNGVMDVFVRDLVTAATTRVSVGADGGEADADCGWPSISGDGRFVAFSSQADTLVPGDTNGFEDIFVHDRDPDGNGIFDEGNGTTGRVSVRSNGAEANGFSIGTSLSFDGGVVAFVSGATNLVGGDRNGFNDVFVHDRASGTTSRVSVASDGTEANEASWYYLQLSADGNLVAFMCGAANLGGADTAFWDIFVHDRATGSTERVSVDSNGDPGDGNSEIPSLSADGRFVAFRSASDDLDPVDTDRKDDVYVRDRLLGTTRCVSLDRSGLPGADASAAAIAGDGARVFFSAGSASLVDHDLNQTYDIFVQQPGVATLAASVERLGRTANGLSFWPAPSGDGRFVAFQSAATDLVPGDTNGFTDVFVNDLSNPGDLASWATYGEGYPGTNGIPSLTASGPPSYGATISVDVANSQGSWTVAFVLFGGSPASIPTGHGGTLLVDFLRIEPLLIPPFGASLVGTTPFDPALCDLSVFLQAIELDAGAARGLSFTPGLELEFGR